MELVRYVNNEGHATDLWLPTVIDRVQSRMTSVKFMVGQVVFFSRNIFDASLLIIIRFLFHTHLSLPPEACASPYQAAQYHILCLSVKVLRL
jgi:hypothetical protein